MPIVKKNDVLPERPVIIVLYGVPGSGKTSVATTADNPLLIDCDRGADRAVQRCDTIMAKCWKDIDSERESMKDYKTIVVDTAKSMIDDYLSQYAIDNNYKLKTNTLKRFGQMGEDFKEFVNFLRSNGSDIVFICHDKETADGDVIKHSPDCTGQSKDLLVRIADQVGYVFIQNGKRSISFAPLDNFVGKNVAGLGTVVIPDYGTTEFDTCMSDIISKVKISIQGKGEAQAKANEQLAAIREQLAAAMTEEDILALMEATKLLPKIMRVPFFSEMQKSLAAKGFTFDQDKKVIRESMIPLIRVTILEAFRKYIEQSDYANYEITEQSVIDSITGKFTGNVYTKIGQAFHKIVEEGTPKCDKVDAGERTFLHYNKEQKEPVPCGRSFDIEGDKVIMDIAQCKTALSYRNEYPNAFHEIRLYKDFGDAIITGCADMVNGVEIRDIKTKYSYPTDADYINSCQWRFYLQLFNLDVFHFDLFIFEGYDKDKHGYDVRGLPLKRYEPSITCYRYDGMEQDNTNLLHSFLEWAEYRDLTRYLLKEKIEN